MILRHYHYIHIFTWQNASSGPNCISYIVHLLYFYKTLFYLNSNQLEKLEAAKDAWLVCLSFLTLTGSFWVNFYWHYWALLGPTRKYWTVLGCTGLYTRCQILCSMWLHCVSKNRMPRRTHQNGSGQKKIWNFGIFHLGEGRGKIVLHLLLG